MLTDKFHQVLVALQESGQLFLEAILHSHKKLFFLVLEDIVVQYKIE